MFEKIVKKMQVLPLIMEHASFRLISFRCFVGI